MTNIANTPTVTYVIKDDDWKIIPNWQHYAVSKNGNVFSLRFGKIMLPQRSNKLTTHLKIRLSDNGKWRGVYVHQLVAQAFLPNPLKKRYINHIDGNPLNNNVSNLEWCTHRENMIHSYKMGLQKIPSNNGRVRKGQRRLTASEAIEIKKLLSEGQHSQNEIAKMFNIGHGAVSLIALGKTWTHIPSLIEAGIALQKQ